GQRDQRIQGGSAQRIEGDGAQLQPERLRRLAGTTVVIAILHGIPPGATPIVAGASGSRQWAGSVRNSALAAEDAAEDAAHDLVAQLGADRAGGLLGHGFDHALAALGAEDRVLDRLAEAPLLFLVLL